MKTNSLLFFVCFAACLVSCNKEIQMEFANPADKVVGTIVVPVGTTQIDMSWKSGDKVSVIGHEQWLASGTPFGVYELDAESDGSKTGKFFFKSGVKAGGTTNMFYAYCGRQESSIPVFQGGGNADAIDLHLCFNVPLNQEYVPDGFNLDYVPMYGYGDSPTTLSFSPLASLFQLRLWDADNKNVKINKITFTSGAISSDYLYQDCYLKATKVDPKACGTQGVIEMQPDAALSTSKTDPTKFNIVIPAGYHTDISVLIYATVGGVEQVMSYYKSSMTFNSGKVFQTSIMEFAPGADRVFASWDGQKEATLASLMGQRPQGTVKITTTDGWKLTDMDMETIAGFVGNAENGSIVLDLGSATCASGSFKDWFANNKSITHLILPKGVVTIGASSSAVISSGSNIKKLTIQEGVTTYENSAFSQYKYELPVPKSVSSIVIGNHYGPSAFKVADGNPTYSDIDGVLFSADKKQLVYYPVHKEGTSYTIPENTTSVYYNAFQYCKLQSLTVPASVTAMYTPFSQCADLANITLLGGDTDLVGGITYDDTNAVLINGVYKNGTVSCEPFTNYVSHPQWSKFNILLGWTFLDGSSSTSLSPEITDLNGTTPSISWE